MSQGVSTAKIDKYLSLNKYYVDESNPHIELVDDPDEAEFDKLALVCPAGLYRRRGDGLKTFDYSGCLECGTCRVLCGDGVIKKWEYPSLGMGVEYRFG